MGYQSDVKMLFKFPDEIRRDAFKAYAKEIMGDAFDWPAVSDRQEGESAFWLVEFNDFKWYDSYSEVQAWHRISESVDGEEEWRNCSCEFIRVGEDDGDVEYRSYGNDDDRRMWTRTEIVCDL